MKPIVIIACVIFFSCLAKSAKADKLVETAPTIISRDSLLVILKNEIASGLKMEVSKNDIHLVGKDFYTSQPVYDRTKSRLGEKIGYILNGVNSDRAIFSYDSINNQMVLEIHFPKKRLMLMTFNNGCFTKMKARTKSISWMQPYKIILSFIPEIVDGMPNLRFLDLELIRHPSLERVKDEYSNFCYNQIESDLEESTAQVFSSYKFKNFLNQTLLPFSADLIKSTVFQNREVPSERKKEKM